MAMWCNLKPRNSTEEIFSLGIQQFKPIFLMFKNLEINFKIKIQNCVTL